MIILCELLLLRSTINNSVAVLILPSPPINRISDSFPYTSKKCRHHSWSSCHSTCKEIEPESKSVFHSNAAGMCVIVVYSLSCLSVVNHCDSVEGKLSCHRTQQHPICEVMVEVCE